MENKQETTPDSKAKVTVTQKEAVAIYFAGFVYHRSDTRENIDHSTRWHCQLCRTKQKCPVKLKLSSDNRVIKISHTHNHDAPNNCKIVFNEVKCKAKKRCRLEPDLSARKILTSELNTAFIEGKVAMEIPVS